MSFEDITPQHKARRAMGRYNALTIEGDHLMAARDGDGAATCWLAAMKEIDIVLRESGQTLFIYDNQGV